MSITSLLTRKLVVKADELAVVNLLEEVLQFLRFLATLDLVERSNVIVNVLCVLLYAHVVQGLQAFLLAHALQCVRQSDQVLEGRCEVPLSLLVLTSEALQIFFDLRRQVACIEVLSCEVGLNRARQHLD